MKKITKIFTLILASCMILGIIALADGSVSVLETYTGDSYISVYIKGTAANKEGTSVQIATATVDQFSIESISNLDKPMQTLVMIDNSVSISSANREKIAGFLQNLISDRLNNEEICIATFSEDITMLTEYTSDYTTLKQAIDSIEYQNQETYLTDVLYDLISTQYTHSDEDVYRRIVVVSDGVDNKSLGYTKEELYSLLKDVSVPIYAIGSVNKNNNDELENMFALSRMTSVDSFLLDDIEDLFELTNTLKTDRDIIKLTITPPAEMLDGGKKAVKLTFPDGSSLTTEITMPQQVVVSEPEETFSKEEESSEEEEEEESETETIIEEDNSEFNRNILLILCAVIAVMIVVATICAILLIVNKKKKNQTTFETVDDNVLRELGNNVNASADRTLMIDSFQNRNNDHSGTVMIWDQGTTTYQVVLTDVDSPAKSFRVPLNHSIVVGRKAEECDIVIDYEKSVSGRHCEISVQNSKFYVKDLQSSNGTFLNGSKVLTQSEIFSGNILKLGRLEMRFEVR